jgi:hypothetical protein
MTYHRRCLECHKEPFSGREDGEAGLLSGAFPAALQPARRLSWLASERARLCLSLPTKYGMVEVLPLHVCMHASQQLARAAFHENLTFSGLREVVLGLVRLYVPSTDVRSQKASVFWRASQSAS